MSADTALVTPHLHWFCGMCGVSYPLTNDGARYIKRCPCCDNGGQCYEFVFGCRCEAPGKGAIEVGDWGE